MNIAIITGKDPSFKNDTDGANVLVKNIALEFADQGYDIDIYTPKGYSGHAYIQPKAIIQNDNSNNTLYSSQNKISIIRFPVPQIELSSPKNQGSNLLNRVKISHAESAFFNDNKLKDYDAVQITHMAHTFGLVSNELLPQERTVVFPMMLGLFYKKLMDVPDEYISLEKQVLQEAKNVLTPSQDEARILQDSYGMSEENVFVINRGFNEKVFKPKVRTSLLEGETIDIVCANMIRPQKGQMYFVDIVQKAKRKGIKTRVHIVGVDGNSYNEYYNGYATDFHERIEKEGLSDYFIFHGVLSQYLLNELMQSSDVAIYPSITETFGKSSLESVVTGLPTIVFDDVPAIREYIFHRETGFFVPRDPSSVVDILEELRSNPLLYSSVSRNGIDIAPQFTWGKITNEVLTAYKDRGILDAQKRP